MNVARVDLNLLKAFEALMIERAVTRAGRRIGLSQPSMSHALTRLRHVFADELFVRTSNGMEPTAKARLIADHVSAALVNVRQALDVAGDFDPSTAERMFSIGATGYAEANLVECFVEEFFRQAPHANLRLAPVSKFELRKQLDEGRIDLAVGHFEELDPWMNVELVLRDPLVLVARPDHHALRDDLSLEAYLDLVHLLVSPSGEPRGAVDRDLEAQGRSRRVGLVTSGYLAVPQALASSDLVAAVPSRVAQLLRQLCGLGVRRLPFDHVVELHMVWHRREDNDAAHLWLRGLVRQVLGDKDHALGE